MNTAHQLTQSSNTTPPARRQEQLWREKVGNQLRLDELLSLVHDLQSEDSSNPSCKQDALFCTSDVIALSGQADWVEKTCLRDIKVVIAWFCCWHHLLSLVVSQFILDDFSSQNVGGILCLIIITLCFLSVRMNPWLRENTSFRQQTHICSHFCFFYIKMHR